MFSPQQLQRPSLLDMIRSDRDKDEIHKYNRGLRMLQDAQLPYADDNARIANEMGSANLLNKNITNDYLPQEFQTSHAQRRANTNLMNINASLAPSKHALAQARHELATRINSPEQLEALMRGRNATTERREYEMTPEYRAAQLKYMQRRGLSNFGKLKADEDEAAMKLEDAQNNLGGLKMGDAIEDGIVPQSASSTANDALYQNYSQPSNINAPINQVPVESKAQEYSGILQNKQPRNGNAYTDSEYERLENNQMKKMKKDLNQYKLAVYKATTDPQARRRALSAALLDYTYKQVPMDALEHYTGAGGAIRLMQDTARAAQGEFVPMLAKYRIYKNKIREWGAENLRSFGGSSVHYKNTERLKQIMGDISPFVPPEELRAEIEGGRRLFENEAQIERSALNEPEFYSVKGYEVPGTDTNITNEMIKEINAEKSDKESAKLNADETDTLKSLILEGYNQKDALELIKEQRARNSR